MNIKEGLKRISISIGYIIFALIGGGIASNEGNFLTTLLGYIIGFYAFKGLLLGINWIVEGFKE